MKDTLKIGSRGADVRTLQTMLNTVGGDLTVDGEFGDVTFDMVCDFQTWKHLEPDGIVGPKTWAALDQALLHHEIHTRQLNADRLEVAGRKAIERALQLWNVDICDPRHDDFSKEAAASKLMIDSMIRDGLGWTWEPPYKGDGDFEWCGAFAAACWHEVKPELRKLYFASTFRLDRYASYQSFNGEVNAGKGRLYAQLDEMSDELPFAPRQGDILIIGPAKPRGGRPGNWQAYGQHICLVESYDPVNRAFHTLEGNGNGSGPHGERQQGVVRGTRVLGGPGWHARRLIRPADEDLS